MRTVSRRIRSATAELYDTGGPCERLFQERSNVSVDVASRSPVRPYCPQPCSLTLSRPATLIMILPPRAARRMMLWSDATSWVLRRGGMAKWPDSIRVRRSAPSESAMRRERMTAEADDCGSGGGYAPRIGGATQSVCGRHSMEGSGS
jgi:hypothetical protein